MEAIATENLFLLEFLVDNVNLNSKCTCEGPPGETCVSFQFLDNAPLDVCEADFMPNRSYRADNDGIKSGKSCLFSLTPTQAQAAIQMFDVKVNIFRKMQAGWLPERVDVGSALISIANLFSDLIETVSRSDGSTPSAKTLKDVFDICNSTGQQIGKISVYIRMSCFGKLIITQFQMNLGDKSVLFKDREGKSLYRYKKAEKKKKCGTNGSLVENPSCPMSSCARDQGFDGHMGAMVPGYQVQAEAGGRSKSGCVQDCPVPNRGPPMLLPQAPRPMIPCTECGGLVAAPCSTPGQNPCAPPNFPVCPPGNYQEIGAAMGNNSLTIRVHKDRNKVEQMEDDRCTEQNINMRPGLQQGNQNLPFSLKMGKCGEGGNGNNVVVNPPVCTAADGTQFTEFSDPNKEMFVLRIGKKSEGVDKKANLELELCTPKGPELKPIPKKETRDTQYDEKDAGPATKPKKGGKAGKEKKGGKKDKDKKGKKGKKKK